MTQNLLLNPGFEADWSEQESHQAHIFKADGTDYLDNVDNIHTPPNWTSWFYHDPQAGNDGYDQPEIRDAWAIHDKSRVHDGDKAILLFTFCRRHDAGFYQLVDVEPGQLLRFTAFSHSWSNHLGEAQGGHPHNGGWSDGAGFEVVAWPVSDNLPYDTGDPQTDAKPNFAFWVGIDPNGGVNPHADSVVWGDGYHIYNGHCQELSVEATAQGDVVTVFLRSKTLWAFTHNDAYWDSAALVAVDEPDPPPEPPPPEPDPPPKPERGAPRVQYERTYILLPPSADAEWALAAIGATWDKSRFTLGSSADDGGIGDLSTRNIIAVNAAEWPTDLGEFYAEHYPGVSVQYIQADTPEQLARLLSLPDPEPPTACLCQRDVRWEDERLAGIGSGCTLTIGEAGCYITALAEAQRHYGIDYDATPLTVQDALLPGGFAGCLPLWSAIIEQCGLIVSSVDTAEADAWLDAGGCAMIEVQPASLQHFVLAVGRMTDGDYIVANPWSGEVGALTEMYPQGVESWRKLEPVGAPPEPPEPPTPDVKTRIGMHLQTMTGGWDTFTSELQPAIMKVLASMQDVAGIKRHSINTAVIWRHVTNDYGDTLENPDPAQGARNWVDKFRDSLYQVCNDLASEFPDLAAPYFYVESLNETYPSLNAPVVRRAADFDLAFIYELETLELPVKPVVFCAAVGNPHETEYPMLVPLARACEAVGGLFGYHNYWRALTGLSLLTSEWEYYGGRWQEMDKVFVANGIHVRWYGGESGAYATAHDGWKSPLCYGGDWDKYLADIVEMQRRIREWNSTHGGRFVGSVLFTSGESYTGWDNFQVRGDETAAMIEAL